MFFEDENCESTTLDIQGNKKTAIIPLDDCPEVNGTVGWIKFDLEGFGLNAFKGMMNTVRRDRPILTLAVCHTPDELFGIKALLENMDLNYRIKFIAYRFDEIDELTPIVYPTELE